MADLAAYERRFRRDGLPLFIEDRSAREDVWTRAAPLLALVFLAQMLGAVDLDWSLLENLGAVAGGLAILLGAFGLLNRLRGRPFSSLPEDVGPAELAAFVLVPAALPLVFGGQFTSALVTAGGNALLLVLSFAVIRYGLLAIVAWAGKNLIDQLSASVTVLSRAVPLLLVFALVLFVNTEMWQVFSGMPDEFLALVGALFATVGFVSQGLQTLVVSVAIGAFFVLFGALAVGSDVRGAWEVSNDFSVLSFDLFGSPVEVTEALLRVSGGIAAFSGLYYAIAVLTDATYREEFREGLTEEMADSFSARAEYLEQRAALR